MGKLASRLPHYAKTEDISNWEETADYVIYKDGANTIAVNGDTGKEDSKDTNSTTVIQHAIDNLPATGGLVFIKGGAYSLDDELTLGSYDSVEGIGYGTELTQTASNKNIFSTAGDDVSIKHMRLVMPRSSSGNIIDALEVNHLSLYNLNMDGCDSTHWLVNLTDFFQPDIRFISGQCYGNGVNFENTDNTYNYGNGTVWNIFLTMHTAGTTGFRIKGNTTKTVNLMTLNYITAQTGAAHANTITGLVMDTARYCTFIGAEFEGLDTGIDLTNATCNTFFNPYMDNITTSLANNNTSFNNQFYGGYLIGDIDDAGYGDLYLLRRNYYSAVRGVWSREERQVLSFMDDFIGDAIDTKWNQTGTWALQNADNGVIRGTTGATSGNLSRLDFGAQYPFKRSSDLLFDTRIKRNETSHYDITWGFTDGGTAAGNEGIYLELLDADTTWFAVCCDGTTKTRVNTTIARSAGWKHWRIAVTVGTATFYNNMVNVAAISSNLPAGATALQPWLQIITREDVAHSMDIDYAVFKGGRGAY